jgi:hypothetical protein
VLKLGAQVFTTYASIETTRCSVQADARKQLREAIERTLVWHTRMTDLIERSALEKLGAWHVYGSLIVDVERLLADVDRVDTAPIEQCSTDMGAAGEPKAAGACPSPSPT